MHFCILIKLTCWVVVVVFLEGGVIFVFHIHVRYISVDILDLYIYIYIYLYVILDLPVCHFS